MAIETIKRSEQRSHRDCFGARRCLIEDYGKSNSRSTAALDGERKN